MAPSTPQSSGGANPLASDYTRYLTQSAPSLASTSGMTQNPDNDPVTPTDGKGIGAALLQPPPFELNYRDNSRVMVGRTGKFPFVQQSMKSESDDPFVAATVPETAVKLEPMDSGMVKAVGLSAHASTLTVAPVSMPLSPNSQAQGLAATNATQAHAQGGHGNGHHILPPNSGLTHENPDFCLFVGNLPNGVPDWELLPDLYREFSKFGACGIKIQHDHRGFTTAFVQYRDLVSVANAFASGGRCVVRNRICRIEQALVRRTLSLLSSDGKPFDHTLALRVIQRFGPVNWMFIPSPAQCSQWRMRVGAAYFQYKMHDDCKNALIGLRGWNGFIVALTELETALVAPLPRVHFMDTMLLWPGGVITKPGGVETAGAQFPAQASGSAQTGSAPVMQNIFGKSVLVTNLPASITCYDLDFIFKPHGTIHSMKISRRVLPVTTNGPASTNILHEFTALIEYDNSHSAANAVVSEQFTIIKGHCVFLHFAVGDYNGSGGFGYTMTPSSHTFGPMGNTAQITAARPAPTTGP